MRISLLSGVGALRYGDVPLTILTKTRSRAKSFFHTRRD
jgi:hypothetical protein